MNKNLKEDLEKAKEELEKQSEGYAEQVKIKQQEEMQKKVDLIWGFINNQNKSEYNIVTKIICRLERNAIEEYIALQIYSGSNLLVDANNIMGIEQLNHFSKQTILELLDFVCSRSLDLYDLDHGTVIEISVEKGE